MAKNKNRNNKKSQNPTQVAPKSETKAEVTLETVVASTTESEFNKNKDTLIAKFREEIDQLENDRDAANQSAEDAKERYEKLEADYTALSDKKDALQKEYDEAIALIDSAESEAQKIKIKADEAAEEVKAEAEMTAKTTRDTADSDAQQIRNDAEKDRLEILMKASDEAKSAWKSQVDSLDSQIADIAKREQALHDAQVKLDKERQNFDFDKEELDDLREHVLKMKDRYTSSSPAKIDSLELELKDAKDKYSLLLESRDALVKKLNENQVILDSIKTELEDSDGGKKLASMRQIVDSMQELKAKYEKLAAVYSKYPDDDSIAALEEKAQQVESFERENNALKQERNHYREETIAARNAKKELEVVRQEVEATNALNEHLLRELESHKTALESRTGDTCPSLSKVDSETEEQDFKNDINLRINRPEIISLKDMVQHVKNYAGSRKKEEQLFYTDNDIRAFLAGMAVSRLIILQGMSGTGKSSLPRIFSEAISGFNRLIPVESSWRDRNELLGYYNDFNKKFNAKSFTIELYKSAKERCQEIPTFIVLDEMNLARIEYYFSDFLAILQEPDHEKWLIELVSSDMRTLPMELPVDIKAKMQKEAPKVFEIWETIERSRQGDLKSETSDEDKERLTGYLAKLGKLTSAKDLIDGRKIKITDNIWFIGTANQDESTFEISDKVYDRAQVVSLNRKGVSEGSYKLTNKKYVSVTALQEMFANAIANFKFKNEVEDRLEELDDILMEKFDISFGNRIVTQTIDFTAVFTEAGGKLTDALDYQISTKIIRKIISSDDGEAFLELLDVTKDYPETQRLINKRLKDLR